MSKLIINVKGVLGCVLKSVKVIRFAKFLSRTLFLIRDLYQDYTDSREYYYKMSELLAFYTTMELKIASKCSSSKVEIAERLTFNYDLHLKSADQCYLLRIIAQVSTFFNQAELLSKVYKKYMVRPKMRTTLPDTLYVWYILTLRRWKSLDTDCIEKQGINQIAALYCPSEDFKNNPLYAPFFPPYNSVNEATGLILHSPLLNYGKLLQTVLAVSDSYPGSDEVIDLCDDVAVSPIDVDIEMSLIDDFFPPSDIKTEVPEVVATIDLTLEDRTKTYEMGWLLAFAEKARKSEIPKSVNNSSKCYGMEVISLTDDEDEMQINDDIEERHMPQIDRESDISILAENPLSSNYITKVIDEKLESKESHTSNLIEISLFTDPENDPTANKRDIFNDFEDENTPMFPTIPVKTYQRKPSVVVNTIDIEDEPINQIIGINIPEFIGNFPEEHSSPSRCSSPPEEVSLSRPTTPPSSSSPPKRGVVNKDTNNILFSGKMISIKEDNNLEEPSTGGAIIFSTGTGVKPILNICSDEQLLDEEPVTKIKTTLRVGLDILDESVTPPNDSSSAIITEDKPCRLVTIDKLIAVPEKPNKTAETPIIGENTFTGNTSLKNNNNPTDLNELKRVSFGGLTEKQICVRPWVKTSDSTININTSIQPNTFSTHSENSAAIEKPCDTTITKCFTPISLITPKTDAGMNQVDLKKNCFNTINLNLSVFNSCIDNVEENILSPNVSTTTVPTISRTVSTIYIFSPCLYGRVFSSST